MSNKLNIKIFIERSNKIHNNKYNYSLVDYKNNRTKVKIICSDHGIFEQVPGAHLRGQICKKCNNEKSNIGKTEFIKISKKIHNNKYDYSLVEYNNNKTKIKIICPIHGEFKQRPDSHLQGKGCNKCAIIYKKHNLQNKDFIEISKKIHNNKYNYSLVNYENGRTKVKIICPIHGIFEQIPYNHSKGLGCHKCKESSGESIIHNYLTDNNIKHDREKKFDGCIDKQHLRYDFYIPEKNICIEYNGEQHYKPIKYFGGLKTYEYIKNHDTIKKKYCIENNIKYLEIRYDDNIIKKLETTI